MRLSVILFCLLSFYSSAQNLNKAQIILNTEGHHASVKSIHFSPDGKFIYSISDDKTVRVWDVEQEECINTYRGYAEPGRVGMLNSAMLSPSGEILAVGGYLGKGEENNGEIRLMNASSGRVFYVLRGHKSPVVSLACTPQEDYLASGSTDGSIGIWSLKSGKGMKLAGHTDQVYVTQFSPSGRHLLTAGYDSSAILWNFREMLVTGKPSVKVLKNHNDKIRCAAFSNDGKYFITAGYDQRVLLYDSSGTLIKTLVELDDQGYNGVGDIHGVSFTSDDKAIVIGTRQLNGNNALTYSFPKGELLHKFKGNDETVLATTSFGKRIVATVGGTNRDIFVWDAYTGKVKSHLVGKGQRVYKVASGPNSTIGLGFKTKGIPKINDFGEVSSVFDLNSLQFIKMDENHKNLKSQSLEWNGNQIVQVGAYAVTLIIADGTRSKIEIDPGADGRINCYSFTPNGNIAIGSNYDLSIFSKEGELLRSYRGHISDVYSLAFNKEKNMMFSSSGDNTTKIWDLAKEGKREVSLAEFDQSVRARYGSERIDKLVEANGKDFLRKLYKESHPKIVKPTATLFVSKDLEWILWTDKKYYASSRKGSSFVGFHQNLHTDTLSDYYSFEQYDVLWNRPDKVLEILGFGSKELIDLYQLAYQKRLRKLDLTEEILSDVEGAPKIVVKTPSQVVQKSRFGFNHTMMDFKHYVAQEHVTINGVPVYGKQGLGFGAKGSKIKPATMQINLFHTNLEPGRNKVQIWCTNTKGIQSNRETRYIYFDTADVKPNLYILGIGVSKYEQDEYNLKYADKDIRDFVRFYSKTKKYNQVFVDTLINNNVTKDNIKTSLEKLRRARVYDHVLIYIAGHGLLDANLDYYLATHDMDFENPSKAGLDYTWLENKIGRLTSRTKTIFIDACHSGEIDVNEVEEVEDLAEGVKQKDTRGAKTKSIGFKENDVSKVMNLLFSDLRNNSGATIIASAGGAEFAFEGDKWNNGVFTYVLLNSLKNGTADLNGDGEIKLSELKKVVQEGVEDLTSGRQVPTSRFESVSLDYEFW